MTVQAGSSPHPHPSPARGSERTVTSEGLVHGEDLAQDLRDDASRETAPRQHSREPAIASLVVQSREPTQALLGEMECRRVLIVVGDARQCLVDLLGADTLAPQLGTQCPTRQVPPLLTVLDPRLGKGGIVDETDVGEATEDLLGRFRRNPAPLEEGCEFRPRASAFRQGDQEDLSGDLDGIGVRVKLAQKSTSPVMGSTFSSSAALAYSPMPMCLRIRCSISRPTSGLFFR